MTETATVWLDHTTSHSRRFQQFDTLCCLINAPQQYQWVCFGPTWYDRVGKKPPVKADTAIYSYVITVSVQSKSVAVILSNKMDFNFCAWMVGFPKSSHI